MEKKAFASWLKGKLEERGMTQADLKRASGITSAQISRLMSGERGMGEKSVLAIARALNLPPDVVFQAAGFLPKETEQTNLLKAIDHVVAALPAEEQAGVLEYAKMRQRLAGRRDAKKDS
jgi:transcriptional regulator with XRE-family HTH domain